MPLYEYRCKTCGQVFEKMVRWSEAALPKEAERSPVCPNCQSQDTQKKMSQVASFGSSVSNTPGSGSGSCGSSGRFS